MIFDHKWVLCCGPVFGICIMYVYILELNLSTRWELEKIRRIEEVEKVRHALLLKDALVPPNKEVNSFRRSICSSKEEKVHTILIRSIHLRSESLIADDVLFYRRFAI